MAQPRPLCVHFRPFHNTTTNVVYNLKLNRKGVNIVLGIRTRGRRMKGWLAYTNPLASPTKGNFMLQLRKTTKVSLNFLIAPSRPLFLLFSSCLTNITIVTTNKCENRPTGIRGWDLNQKPLEHKSPPITTRPGLP